MAAEQLNFTGTVTLDNVDGKYYNDYTQTGVLSISLAASPVLGGNAKLMISSNGLDAIGFSSDFSCFGFHNNNVFPVGVYGFFINNSGSKVDVTCVGAYSLGVLDEPTSFNASADGTTVTLTWTSSNDVEIQRAVNSSFSDATTIATVSANSYVDNNNGLGLSESTAYYYRIKAVQSGYDDSPYVTDSATTGLFVPAFSLSDDFTGTTIDTAKHTIYDLNAGLTITQNNKLIFQRVSGGTSFQITKNYARSVTPYDMSTIAMAFDLNLTSGNLVNFFCGFRKLDTTNSIADMCGVIYHSGSYVGVRAAIYDGTTLATSQDLPLPSLTGFNRIKIFINGDSITFSRWNGTAWGVLATLTHTLTFTTGYHFFSRAASAAGTELMEIDNLDVRPFDFSTERA